MKLERDNECHNEEENYVMSEKISDIMTSKKKVT